MSTATATSPRNFAPSHIFSPLPPLHYPQPQIYPISTFWRGDNPQGFYQGQFMVLKAFADESLSDGTAHFAVAALCASGDTWESASELWQRAIDETNAELAAQSRPLIRRYHASDLNCRASEFDGWTETERRALHERLLPILESHKFQAIGVVLDRQAIQLPAWDDIRGWHSLALLMMLSDMDKFYAGTDARISVVHDRVSYAGVLTDIFESVRNAPTSGNRFVNFKTEGWEDCVPLQLADFIAFETLKLAQCDAVKRPTLARLTKSPNFRGRLRYYKQHELQRVLDRYQHVLDAIDPAEYI